MRVHFWKDALNRLVPWSLLKQESGGYLLGNLIPAPTFPKRLILPGVVGAGIIVEVDGVDGMTPQTARFPLQTGGSPLP